MKARLELELFGEETRQVAKLWKGVTNDLFPGLGWIFNMPASSWVAEIIGRDVRYKYKRSFLRAKKDYSRSNDSNTRGTFAEYILSSGNLYQVKARVSWKKSQNYFCIVSEIGDIVKISEKEAEEWVRNRWE